MKNILAVFALLLLFTACEPAADSKEKAADTPKEQKPAATAKKYAVTAFTPSQAYPDAKLRTMKFQDGKFTFGVFSYDLGVQTPDAAAKMCANSAKGQHIHLIIDNEPYNARYTAEFDDVTMHDGVHHVLAFLSRSYHESIKTKDAHLAYKVSVKNQTIVATEKVTTPMLFYSRPKGTYVGKDTKKVMLDFYPVNAPLGAGQYSVKADINGEIHMITEWQPYYVEGLPMGDNKITLTLLDKDGNTVETPLNPVTRKFTLKADELEK